MMMSSSSAIHEICVDGYCLNTYLIADGPGTQGQELLHSYPASSPLGIPAKRQRRLVEGGRAGREG